MPLLIISEILWCKSVKHHKMICITSEWNGAGGNFISYPKWRISSKLAHEENNAHWMLYHLIVTTCIVPHTEQFHQINAFLQLSPSRTISLLFKASIFTRVNKTIENSTRDIPALYARLASFMDHPPRYNNVLSIDKKPAPGIGDAPPLGPPVCPLGKIGSLFRPFIIHRPRVQKREESSIKNDTWTVCIVCEFGCGVGRGEQL